MTLALAPGSALDETQLSKEFNISRTPFREVLQRLAGEGYVTTEQNRGAVVTSMSLDVIHSFFQTAPMIYASVARLAAENATPENVANLQEIQRQFSRAVVEGHMSGMVHFNHRFHEYMGEMAANPYLFPALGKLLIDHTRMSQTFYRPRSSKGAGRIGTACNQHDEMICD